MASHYIRWSQGEDDFLKDNYYLLGAKAIAQKLGRSANAVSHRMSVIYKKEMEKNVRSRKG